MTIHYTIHGTAKRLADVPAGAKVIAINGRFVLGKCETCGKRVLEGSIHHPWADGVLTCAKCGGPEKMGEKRKGRR